MNWDRAPRENPRGKLSLESPAYLAFYGAFRGKRRPEDNENWATESARLFEPASIGSQLADENLARRKSSFMTADNFARLEQVRGEFDPEGRIHSYGHLDEQVNSGDM